VERVDEPAKLTIADLERLLGAEFPEMFGQRSGLVIEAAAHSSARVRQTFRSRMTRPGGTISGGAMMALADFTMYVAVLASIGWVPLAVTTHLSIDFLSKPAARDLIADARLLKLSRKRAVGTVELLSDGESEPVAFVTASYAIPAR
jgi:uncharacterized protein (TIGR00369 family)